MSEDAERYLERVRELVNMGDDWIQASGKASLEQRINDWPKDWGDDLQILLYGDFLKPPESEMYIEPLGITIYPEKLEKTIIKSALCVVKAKVRLKDKSVEGLTDAVRRINVLLGSWTLVEWGNGACGWWSWVTHGGYSGVGTKLDHKDLYRTVEGILQLPQPVRQKIDAALFWIREPRNLLMNSYRSDLLRRYTAYWNSFECLVDAFELLRPQKELLKVEKKQRINEIISSKSPGEVTLQDIIECSRIVNPGFVGKARVC